jgi:gamma-glutamyltranspeptidase/glutathione hydrolase
MIVRFNNKNGTGHSYETIDFRETMPAAGNLTVSSASAVALKLG